MGGTFVADYIEEQIRLLPRHLVEAITQSPSSFLTIARGKGDSMEPTIRDQDMVIIDRSRKKLDEQDAIWALTVGGIGMIKRLRLRGRDVVIQSDNREVRDEIVNNEEVHLVGRVVFIGRNT
jgi:phage repressor protein C with HTH and peptisase S24 domain